MKWKCILAWRLLHKYFSSRINDLKSVIEDPLYDYMSGDKLFGLENNPIPCPKSTYIYIFYVRGYLACHMAMEKLYYCK